MIQIWHVPRKPAAVKAGKSETQQHLNERAELEEEMAGNDSLVWKVPEDLDTYGKEFYEFLINEFSESNFLSNLDVPILHQTSDCLSKMKQADEILAVEGIKYDTFDKFGNVIPKEHPMVKTKLAYLTQYRALATQLGLSPSARASLSQMKIEAKDESEDPLLKALRE